MLRWKIFTLLFILTSLVFAQNSDYSPIQKWKDSLNNSTEHKEIVLYYLASSYLKTGKYDSAIIFFNKSLEGYSTNQNKAGSASIHNNLGVTHFTLGNIDSAIYHYKLAKAYYLTVQDSINIASTDLNLGIVYKESGSYSIALEYLISAAKVFEYQNRPEYLASSLISVANIYSKQSDFDQAINYNHHALNLFEELQQDNKKASILNNLGNIYRQIEQYDSAQYYLSKALTLKENQGDNSKVASTLNNLGEVSIDMQRYDVSLEYFQQAASLNPPNKNKKSRVITFHGLARSYVKLNRPEIALTYLDSALILIYEQGLLAELKQNLETRVSALEKLDQPGKALSIAKELLIIKDSLLNQQKMQSLLEMQSKYETEKKEQSIASLRTESELQNAEIKLNRLWILSLVLVVIGVFIIGLIIYNRFKVEKKSKRQIETLLQELHHRVKNNLQLLSSIFSLQSRVIKDSGALEAVKSSENRVNAMAIIHQKLYTKSENRNINIQDYFNDLITQLADSYGFDINSNYFILDIDKVSIDLDKVISLGLVVNEVVSNSLKHAFSDVKNPQIKIKVKVKGEGLEMGIKDNGKGFNYNTPRKSMGLNIIETLSRQLQANIEWQTTDGVFFKLNMKLS